MAAHQGDDWDGHPWLMMIFGLGGGQELVCVALRGAPRAGLSRRAGGRAALCVLGRERGGDRPLALAPEPARGVDFWEERHGDQRSVYFADPDGVVLEVTWPPTKVYGVEVPAPSPRSCGGSSRRAQPA